MAIFGCFKWNEGQKKKFVRSHQSYFWLNHNNVSIHIVQYLIGFIFSATELSNKIIIPFTACIKFIFFFATFFPLSKANKCLRRKYGLVLVCSQSFSRCITVETASSFDFCQVWIDNFTWMGRFGLCLLTVDVFKSKLQQIIWMHIKSHGKSPYLFIGFSKFREHIGVHLFLFVVLLFNFLFANCNLVDRRLVFRLKLLRLRNAYERSYGFSFGRLQFVWRDFIPLWNHPRPIVDHQTPSGWCLDDNML